MAAGDCCSKCGALWQAHALPDGTVGCPRKRPPRPAPETGVCCGVCGSRDVQYAVWYAPNTREVLDVFGSWNAGDNTFCGDCDLEGRNPNAPLVDSEGEPEEFRRLRRAAKRREKKAAEDVTRRTAEKGA